MTRTEKYERITVIYPDGTMTRAGQWDYSDAIQYAAPIVFGPLGKQARQVIEQEYYFDDDPADLELLINNPTNVGCCCCCWLLWRSCWLLLAVGYCWPVDHSLR